MRKKPETIRVKLSVDDCLEYLEMRQAIVKDTKGLHIEITLNDFQFDELLRMYMTRGKKK